MNARTFSSKEIHQEEIHANAARWENKPLLQEVYGNFYEEIAARIQRTNVGSIVELGSGLGNIKKYIPDCVTTDIFENPCVDQVENAYRLSFGNNSVSNLILFDVLHHLRYPGTALMEFHRVLVKGGRLIVFEPAMGLLGKVVYGLFHKEPLGLKRSIEWEAPTGFVPEECEYFAAQSWASRIFGTETYAAHLDGWHKKEVCHWSALSYLASGGFTGKQLYPRKLLPLMRKLDSFLATTPRLFSARMLVVMEKIS